MEYVDSPTRKSVAAEPVVENIHCDVLGTLAATKCTEYLTGTTASYI